MLTNESQKNLVEECKIWYKSLADYREKVNKLKTELYDFAPGKTNKDVLLGIEHYHNQFHIQLINIHDLQHELKPYIVAMERNPDVQSDMDYNEVKSKYEFLINDLDKLETDFHEFIL